MLVVVNFWIQIWWYFFQHIVCVKTIYEKFRIKYFIHIIITTANIFNIWDKFDSWFLDCKNDWILGVMDRISSFDLGLYIFVCVTKRNVNDFHYYPEERTWLTHFNKSFEIRFMDPIKSNTFLLNKVSLFLMICLQLLILL